MKTQSRTTFLVLVLLATGCFADASDSAVRKQNEMKIVAKGLEFIAPAEVSPGWTRFQLDNRSEMLHFAVLQKMPEGIGIRQQQEQIAPVFQQGMNHLKDGDVDAAMAAFGNLPEWFGEIVFFGGPGLISPGQTATIYVHLEPGRYLLECYVKTGGIFHSYNPDKSAYGMVHEFYVPEGEDVTAKPEHTSTITLSSNNGIKIDGPITSGPQTIAVTYADQKTYEHFLGHDLHLAKLDESTGTSDLARWMNWMLPGGLETPAPVEFIAGVHEMPAGNTAYLEVDLEPGDYVWIAEVPDPAAKGMLKTFSVRN